MINLNKEQQAIIDSNSKAICVIAGPGSGKTRVLSEKVTSLLESGVHSGNILAITFTNKAANEMRERIIRGTQKDTKYLSVCTFHSLGMRILRENYARFGYHSNIVIMDDTDTKRMIERIIKSHEFVFKTDEVIKAIAAAKNNLIAPEDYIPANLDSADHEAFKIIFKDYEAMLNNNNGLDFNDLISKTVELLRENSDLAEKLQQRYTHVFVDEFQDTNIAQYEFIKLIAKHNVLVVGDQDQSIYGWRGAHQEITNMFIADFDATIFKLEHNYRSTNAILKAANSLIESNKNRIKKDMWSDREDGMKITHRVLATEKHEAEFIAQTILDKVAKTDLNFSDFTVLYRNNEFSRVLEEYFINYRVPYHIHSGVKFFQRKEIKDVVGYMKVIFNPDDNSALIRIINNPKRSLGDTTVHKLQAIAKEEDISIWQLICQIEKHDFTKVVQTRLIKFKKMILDLQKFSKVSTLAELYQKTLTKSEYLKMLEKDSSEIGLQRIANIEELASFLVECDEREEGLEEFLTNAALIESETGIESRNKVKFMTIHASKGLEFNVVFVVGLEEDLFPSRKAILQDEIEEERRLMYVAITRAKDEVYLTNVKSRLFHGVKKSNPISRFVNDIEDHFLDREYGKHDRKKDRYNYETNSDIGEGDTIKHDDFGLGTVEMVTGDGDTKLITIKFEDGTTKTLLAFHPKINKIG